MCLFLSGTESKLASKPDRQQHYLSFLFHFVLIFGLSPPKKLFLLNIYLLLSYVHLCFCYGSQAPGLQTAVSCHVDAGN